MLDLGGSVALVGADGFLLVRVGGPAAVALGVLQGVNSLEVGFAKFLGHMFSPYR